MSSADQSAFVGFAAAYNKDYDSMGELEFRRGVWFGNRKAVDRLNRKNKGVSFELNETADMTDDEFESRLGLKPSRKRKMLDDEFEEDFIAGRRHLNDVTPVNWVEKGNVCPVKNQG